MPADFTGLTPEARSNLMLALDELRRAGIKFNVTSAYRSPEKQAELYANRATNPFPVAPPGSSAHEKGTAADVALADEGQRSAASKILAKYGFSQPLPKQDRVHYQYGGTPRAAEPERIAPPPQAVERIAPPAVQSKGVERIAPPKFERIAPPTAATAYRPNLNIPRDVSGRVIDPTTGQPFVKGTPHETPKRALYEQGLEAITPLLQGAQGGLQGGINRVSAPLYPLRDLLNKIGEETGNLAGQHGGMSRVQGSMNPSKDATTQAVLRALHRWAPWETLKRGVLKGEPTDLHFFQAIQKGDPEFRAALQKAHVPAPLLDFLGSFAVDAISGHAQEKVVGAGERGLQKLNQATGATQKLEAAIPAYGRLAQGRRAYQQASEIYSRQMAGAEEHTRAAADFAEDVRKTSQAAMKRGAQLRAKDAITGRTTNRLAELAGDWMEAGSPGARFNLRRDVIREAVRYNIDPADVVRLGNNGEALADKIGKDLVNHGLISKTAYQNLKGQYLPRLYLLYSQTPKEGEKLLQRLEQQNLITPDEAGNVRGILATRARYSGGAHDFTKAREITSYAQRTDPSLARFASTEATPALTRYAHKAAGEIGEARALDEISQNPNLAVPKTQANPEQLAQWPRLEINGVEHVIHPGVKRLLDLKNSSDAGYEALRRISPEAARNWRSLNQKLRAIWVSSPKTAVNNAAGNYQLGASAAALNGAEYSLPRYVQAVKAIRDWRKAGKVTDPLLKEAIEQTDILAGSQGLIPKGAASVKGGFGVETAGQKLAALPGRAYEGYANTAYRDIEQAGRFTLYKALRQAGKDPQEAARITRAAMIDYTDVGPIRQFLEKNNVTPFITFPTKAIFQYANLALRRPDLFNTYTGERLRNFLDTLADEEAAKQGKKPSAKARRQAGYSELTDFPIPGQFYPNGEQRYLRTSLLAPILQAGPSPSMGQENLLTPLQERVKSGLPLLRVPAEMLLNRQTFNGEPIVPPGSVPGSDVGLLDALQHPLTPELGGAYASHALRSFLPQMSDVERGYHALTGTTQYPGQAHMEPWAAGLQAVTGIQVRPGLGLNPTEKRVRAGTEAESPGQQRWQQFQVDYETGLQEGKTPIDPDYRNFLATRDDSRWVRESLDGARKRLRDLVISDTYAGKDRAEAIRRITNWVYALAERYGQMKTTEASGLAPELGGTP